MEAANNFLAGYSVTTPEELRILLANVGFSDAISASVIAPSTAPNVDPLEEKKKEERALDALLAALQEQIRAYNERISELIDKCREMAEWCRKQAEKIDETIKKSLKR